MDEDLDLRFECGYSKPSSQLTLLDRQKLVNAVWLHYVFFLPHAELQKGFRETLQLEALISNHPNAIYGCLVASSNFDVTPEFLIDSFTILYSEQGHNKRTAEEAIILSWCDYVMESAGKKVTLLLHTGNAFLVILY